MRPTSRRRGGIIHGRKGAYHDIHARLTGPVVRDVFESFRERREVDRVATSKDRPRQQHRADRLAQASMTRVILDDMKTAVSIPDAVFEQAERAARRLRLSRSELYARAVRQFLERQWTSRVTEQLDRVYAEDAGELDPALAALQAASLDDGGW